MKPLGTLEILRRYPVKSMRGEDLLSATGTFSGLVGDRVYAFVDAAKAADFPWHSARERPALLLYTPRFVAAPPASVRYPAKAAFTAVVTTPAGERLAIDSEALRAEVCGASGAAVHLRFSEKGMHDSRPLSLFGLDTVRGLEGECGRALDPARFRANLYVRWASGAPFFEDTLVGRRLRIGEHVEVMVVKKDPRCVIITMDPGTAESHPEVLRAVAKTHRGCAGVYAAVLREGQLTLGDSVTLVD